MLLKSATVETGASVNVPYLSMNTKLKLIQQVVPRRSVKE
jgi:hypothetical protein